MELKTRVKIKNMNGWYETKKEAVDKNKDKALKWYEHMDRISTERMEKKYYHEARGMKRKTSTEMNGQEKVACE